MKGVLKMQVNVKLFLVDTNGNSPSFGVDEEIEITADDYTELQKHIANARNDFAHFLVANEGFGWSDIVGYDVCKNEKDYEVKASY